ncbi:hypothetical protein J3R83DRAFT_5975 [Lanmaoa asiatica]|nr:hypothetical protein J3R83DRAFT_5975 [Lanmaoa asiatica]
MSTTKTYLQAHLHWHTMSKRRKKAGAASDSEISAANTGITTRSNRACAPCRRKKVKCEYPPGSDICRRCTGSDPSQCAPQPPVTRTRKTRAVSLSTMPLPSSQDLDVPVCTQATVDLAVAGGPHKRPEQGLQESACMAKRQRLEGNPPAGPAEPPQQADVVSTHSVTTLPASDFGLEPIYEAPDEEEVDFQVYRSDIQSKSQSEWPALLSHPGNFLSSIIDDSNNTSSGDEDMLKEDQALIKRNTDSSSDESDDDDDFKRLLRAHAKTKAQSKQPKHKVSTTMKKSKLSSSRSAATDLDLLSDSDSDSSFDIKCVVRRSKGSSSLLDISSTITFNELLDAVAKRLKRHPDNVLLRYRLSTMKQKDASINIESDEELAMFISRIRSIIFPPRRKDGKPSARPLKEIEVCFEDAGISDADDSQAHDSSGKGRANGKSNRLASVVITSTSSSAQQIKLTTLLLLQGSNSGLRMAQRGSKRASSEIPTEHPDLLDGTARRGRYVSQLQSRWQCIIHTKSPQSPVWCYRNPTQQDPICQKLTYSHLSFWALEVMEGRATIEEKPLTLNLGKSKAENPGPSNPMLQCGHLAPAGPLAGNPYYPPPPYYYLPHTGIPHAYRYDTATAPTVQAPFIPSQTVVAVPSTSRPSQADLPIVQWFAYLDQVEERNNDGITFAPYSQILRENQFMRVSQLLEFTSIPLTSLQELLKIPLGVATLIIQYAKHDLEDLRAGRWVFPGPRNDLSVE